MSGFVDRLKKGADRAALEADKLRRITSVRTQISNLKTEVNQATRALGRRALELFDAGQLSQAELLEICEQITVLQRQIAGKEAEIEAIRQETPPETPEPALYGHVCPKCKIRLPDEARFCPECGSPAEDFAPSAASKTSTGVACSNCGAPLVEGAAFCSECGTRVEKPQTVSTKG